MARLHIVALGSSFASGTSIEPIEDQTAGRSSRNYAHQLAERLDADLTDLTVSGATLMNVLNEKQSLASRSFDPQLDHLPPNADIITITCGGNDLGYIGNLVYDSLMSYLGPIKNWFSRMPTPPGLNHRQLTDRFLAVLDRIHEIAPKSKVYMVEYLSIIGDDTRPWVDIALTANEIRHYTDRASLLSRAYSEAAGMRPWVELVPVAEQSRAHALGSPDPWVEGFNLSMLIYGPATYHPNLAGHSAIAELLYQSISAQRQPGQE